MDNDIIDTTEAARLLGVTRSRINVLLRSGRLPATRLGTDRRANQWAIRREDVMQLVEQRQRHRPAPGRPRKETTP